jgi:dTDP-4-dehydrorhamnose 3,5-epimerase-like enzyme
MKSNVNYKNGQLAWRFIEYPSIKEPGGLLGVIEYGKEIDFTIKRVFFLRNIEIEVSRGFHAHNELKQFIFCANGSFVIELDNGDKKYSYELTQDSPGLWVDGKVWREMHSFSSDSVMMVLCDREYRFDTVVRDYADFKKNLERSSV